MKIKTLLDKANKCMTVEDAQELLETLKRVFGNSRPLSHLCQTNDEAYMKDDEKPCVHFELNREISDDFVTTIRPEISDGAVVVSVLTNHMLDGHGMMSKHREVIEVMDDLIECEPYRTVLDVAQRAAELAISQHRMLIESIGVPQIIAEEAAKKCW
jgi:hypothetical protein